jgi:hypothetical protein
MSKDELGNVPQIARTLIDHLPEEMDRQLRELIVQAETGRDTSLKIVRLFAQHESTRSWLEVQLASLQRRSDTPSTYSGLAGNPSVPMSRRWVCPEKPSEHWLIVIQEGESPPKCKIDGQRMVRGS